MTVDVFVGVGDCRFRSSADRDEGGRTCFKHCTPFIIAHRSCSIRLRSNRNNNECTVLLLTLPVLEISHEYPTGVESLRCPPVLPALAPSSPGHMGSYSGVSV